MAKTENFNEEVMENQETVKEMDIEIIGQPEESKAKKIWNKIKKPLAYTTLALVSFGIGLASGKYNANGSLELGDQATNNIVE